MIVMSYAWVWFIGGLATRGTVERAERPGWRDGFALLFMMSVWTLAWGAVVAFDL
jgi:hypothetical protein